jgi:hypothetical protein
MNAPAPGHPDAHTFPLRIRWFMAAAWVAILAKCVFVTWAVGHWRMPFHAAWVVIPTLLFAALATVLWAGHHE